MAPAGATPATNTLVIDSALADWVYHMAGNDQALGLGEIETGATIFTRLDRTAANALGLTISPDGFIYNYQTGFAAAIVQDAAGYAVVFRGTDVGEANAGDIIGAAAGTTSPSNPNMDVYDIQRS